MNNNNQNNNDNIVTPTQVNLNNVQVDQNQDNFLNRERENIVSATIQANQAIDKTQAKEVNNEFKIKKNNSLVATLIIGIGLIVAVVLGLGVVKLMKQAENYGTQDQTTTKLTAFEQSMQYLTNYSKVRKYQNTSYVLMLSPESFDMVANKKYYMLLTTGDRALVRTPEIGTYEIVDKTVTLTNTQTNTVRTLNLVDGGLIMDNYVLEKKDTEMKSYVYQNTNESAILMINGTLYNEQALFISTNSLNTTFSYYKFTEDKDTITLENGTVFTKEGMNIVKDGKTYNYIQ